MMVVVYELHVYLCCGAVTTQQMENERFMPNFVHVFVYSRAKASVIECAQYALYPFASCL